MFINLCFSTLFGANQLKIAILDLKPGVGVTTSDADGLSDMLTLELYQSGYFNIMNGNIYCINRSKDKIIIEKCTFNKV